MRQLSQRLSAVLIAVALVAVLLLQLAEARKVLFERSRVPQGWLPLRRAALSSPVRFTIGLQGATVDDMAATFWSISDPTSADYLQLLDSEQVDSRFGPSSQQRDAVQQWLMAGGVSESELKHVSSAIEVSTSAAVAERLFATEMRVFQHGSSGKQVVKAWGSAELPDHIHPAVELVSGLSSFPVPRTPPVRTPRASEAPMDPEAVVPQTLRALYQIRPQQSGSGMSTQGLIEFEGQSFNNRDTAAFAAFVGYDSGNATIQPIAADHIVGANTPSFPGVESTLDVQWMSSTNLEAQTWFWIEDFTSWLYEYALHALNTTTKPQVVSISYGLWEGMQCFADASECELLDLDSSEYTAATNALFMKLGMQGTSIVVASGDSGANSRTDETCAAYNLRPEYPASSPYVTTVGATMVVNATYGFTDVPACKQGNFSCIASGREVAVSRNIAGFTSGGGFSNITGATRPAYQDSVVQAYLSSGVALPPDSYYNVQGRAEPDVAAVGSLGLISIEGEYFTIGGTSMSSPIFAGVASLLNEIAVNKTGKPLGFLNPLLYKMYADEADTFHDITEGDNICPEEYCGPKCKGYVATKGWDPVTGLGTPNAARMEAYVSKLLDDVLARRRSVSTAKDAAATAAPFVISRFSSPPKSQPTDVYSAYLARRNSSLLAQAQQRRPAVKAVGAMPDETWAAFTPLAIGFTNGSIVAVTETTILSLRTDSFNVLQTCPIDSALTLGGFAATESTAFALLLDYLYGNVYINGINPQTCETTSSAPLKYPADLLSVDNAGKLALTTTNAHQVVWFDTATGERRGVIANASWDVVTWGAINSANSDVWVAWVQIGKSSLTSGITVKNGDTTRFTITRSGGVETIIQDVIVDSQGKYAYMLLLSITRDGGEVITIEQLDATSGESLSTYEVPSNLLPTTDLATRSERSGLVYWMSYNKLVSLESSGIVVQQVGQYPLIELPTDVAVTADGTVLVVSTASNQIQALNSSGQIVSSYPSVEEPEVCDLIPFLNVAVDYEGNVYMPLCNSTVLIFDSQGDLLTQVSTGQGTIPRSVAPGPHNTLFFTDDNNHMQVQHIDRDGNVIHTFTLSTAGWLFTVKYNWRADSIHVTDVLKGVIYQWAVNGTGKPTVLDVGKAVGDPAAEVYSLAIDHHHSQLIVSAELVSIEAGALLWFDMDGTLLAKNYTFPVGTEATGVAVSYDGSRVYATDLFNSAVYVFYQDEQTIQKTERRAAGKATARVAAD